MSLSQPDISRVLGRVAIDPVTICWLWTGACDSKGYGIVRRGGKQLLLHRVVYSSLRTPVKPRKDHLHHLCQNRRCVNPDHLEVVTPKEHKAAHASQLCREGHELVLGWGGRRHCAICKNTRRRQRRQDDPEYAARIRVIDREWHRRRRASG